MSIFTTTKALQLYVYFKWSLVIVICICWGTLIIFGYNQDPDSSDHTGIAMFYALMSVVENHPKYIYGTK